MGVVGVEGLVAVVALVYDDGLIAVPVHEKGVVVLTLRVLWA
eukprot:COSAG06_NODE_10398_length_1687_cov_182.739924_2_plen_42_part_00